MLRAYTDGACRVSNPGVCSCAFAVFDEVGLFHSDSRYLGPELKTNNFAEFSGLLDCLKWAEGYGAKRMTIHCDSQLVVKTVLGEWNIKHEELKPLHSLAYALLTRGEHHLLWVRGHNGDVGNEYVDKLCNETLDGVLGVSE